VRSLISARGFSRHACTQLSDTAAFGAGDPSFPAPALAGGARSLVEGPKERPFEGLERAAGCKEAEPTWFEHDNAGCDLVDLNDVS
jgi:hypothetical protein